MRFLLLGTALVLLAACGTKPGKTSSPQEILASIYRPAVPSMTLVTVINNRTGNGAHSALLVEGSQSVLFDPAGSYVHPDVPERGDVLFGMSPLWMQSYKSSHARREFHVVSQRIPVTAEQAETALQLVQAHGAVADAQCALTTSRILSNVPGFQSVRTGYYPKKLMSQIGSVPGVKTEKLFEDDDGDVIDGVQAQIIAQSQPD